ncbi:hypothetical protein ZWY2020_004853 [Hordeum vulgare]|nr:hypothetical protein ZWY2020_004853 [Hordeum vulgare]
MSPLAAPLPPALGLGLLGPPAATPAARYLGLLVHLDRSASKGEGRATTTSFPVTAAACSASSATSCTATATAAFVIVSPHFRVSTRHPSSLSPAVAGRTALVPLGIAKAPPEPRHLRPPWSRLRPSGQRAVLCRRRDGSGRKKHRRGQLAGDRLCRPGRQPTASSPAAPLRVVSTTTPRPSAAPFRADLARPRSSGALLLAFLLGSVRR